MSFSFSDFSIPVSLFVGLYGVFLLFYVIYAFFNILNLMKHGRISARLFVIVTVFIGGSILLIAGSLFWLMQYDWTLTTPASEIFQSFKQASLHTSGF